jgi:hypothetical protein
MRRRPSVRFLSRRGSVIVVVLVTLLFASLLLTRLIEASSTDLLIAMRRADRDRLRADAYSALETTLAALMDFRTVDRSLYAPAQGWADPLAYAGYAPREGVTVAVSFEDESAKLSLPRLNPDSLTALFVQLGLVQTDAARVADAILVWTRNGHVAAETATSAAVYEQADPPYEPPYRGLRSFDELAAINVARDFFFEPDGRPKPLLSDFRQAVSLYQFASTNLNSAPPVVLLAAGWDASQVQTLQKFLTNPPLATKTPPYFTSMKQVQQQLGQVTLRNIGVQIQCLRINVDVRQGAAQMQLSALVTWSGQARLPAPVAANADRKAAATGGRAAASSASRPSPSAAATAAAAGKSLMYPFTLLELTEITPVTPSPTSS